ARRSNVEPLLAWPTLVFYVPVAFGALLAVGAAFGIASGGAEADGSIDADGDGIPDGDGQGEGEAADSLSVLALGRLPLAVRLMLLAFSFGGVGLLAGPVIRALTPGPPAVGG